MLSKDNIIILTDGIIDVLNDYYGDVKKIVKSLYSFSITDKNEVIDTPVVIKDPENAKTSSDKKGYLTFKNVSFTYKGADVPAIKDLSFEAKREELLNDIYSFYETKTNISN